MSMKLAQANGGNLSEGAASILGGSILEVLEQIDRLKEGEKAENIMAGNGEETDRLKSAAEAIDNLTNAVARLRRGDHDKELLRQNDAKLKQKDQELDLAAQRFQRDTCDLFIKWAQDQRAVQLAAAPLSNESKLEQMGKLMFGELWERAQGPKS
jgi:hypothetical protein